MKRPTTILLTVLSLFIFAAGVSAQKRIKRTVLPKPIAQKPARLTAAAVFQNGSFTGTTYKNTSLSFAIALPDTWHLLGEETNRATLEAGAKSLKENRSEKYKEHLDQSLSKTAVLFQATPGKESDAYANGLIACAVEDKMSDHTTLAYVEENKKGMLGANPDLMLSKDTYQRTLGGLTFHAVDFERPKLYGVGFGQTLMVTQRRGLMFFFVLTYPNEEVRASLEAAF